jgi:hypothetical protein
VLSLAFPWALEQGELESRALEQVGAAIKGRTGALLAKAELQALEPGLRELSELVDPFLAFLWTWTVLGTFLE